MINRTTDNAVSVAEAPPDMHTASKAIWDDAIRIVMALGVGGRSLGGVIIRSSPGHARDQLAALYRDWSDADTPFISCAGAFDAAALLGGLDVTATLATGKPSYHDGLLARAGNGVLIVRGAERIAPAQAAIIAQALDTGRTRTKQTGDRVQSSVPATLVLFDEGVSAEEITPAVLFDRVAFAIDVNAVSWRDCENRPDDGLARIKRARAMMGDVQMSDALARAIAVAAENAGIEGIRPLLFSQRAAKIFAALDGRLTVNESDAALACRLVLRPRANAGAETENDLSPSPQEDRPPGDDGMQEKENAPSSADTQDDSTIDKALAEQLADIMTGSLTGGHLHLNFPREKRRTRHAGIISSSGEGVRVRNAFSGRAIGVESHRKRRNGKINIIATLKSAAPWQRIRARDQRELSAQGLAKIRIYPSDLRVTQFEKRRGSSIIFVVDASGSAAFERLAETKGAIERLLQDCYSRRDVVSVVSFRGTQADILLPPTNALVRAKRALSALPGGGGTPLARGLFAAEMLAQKEQSRGRTPFLVVLSDGGANIDKHGQPGRAAARADGEAAARLIAGNGRAVLFFDTGRRPSPAARALADALCADYQVMPHAGSQALPQIVANARQVVKTVVNRHV